VESARDVEVLRARFPAVNSIIALIETHLGVLNSSEIAQAHPSRLAFGSVDYFARMGMEPTSLGSIFPLSTLVVASMAFGLPAPIDGPTLNLESEQTLRDDLRESKAIGAGAKMCVHPRQVELVNDYFSSDAHDVVWAQEIVDLARQHVGVFVHQGKMIDEPIVERARRILNDG
jgi:citrate lyase subunit beta/citryl-CoA lyase